MDLDYVIHNRNEKTLNYITWKKMCSTVINIVKFFDY